MLPSEVEKNERLCDLAAAQDATFWEKQISQLSEPERVFRLIWQLEAEVNNGGFHQYFFNPTGRFAQQAPGALKAIGALRTAEIVSEAIASVGTVPWDDETQRQLYLDRLPEAALETLTIFDEKFQDYEDDLTSLLYNYVSSHRQALGASWDS